eukprot:3705919-Pleurochrysis_carterae.AAC.1
MDQCVHSIVEEPMGFIATRGSNTMLSSVRAGTLKLEEDAENVSGLATATRLLGQPRDDQRQFEC